MINKKNIVIEKLTELANKVTQVETGVAAAYKRRVYLKAVKAIQNLKVPLKNGDQIAHIKGIGPSSVAKVNEILETGTLKQLEKYDINYEELLRIPSVGPAKAKKLHETYGIKTLYELVNLFKNGTIFDAKLERNLIRTLMLKNKRIPRAEMLEIAEPIMFDFRVECPKANVILGGSIRREKPTCKDIDIIFAADDQTIEEGRKVFLAHKWDDITMNGDTRISTVTQGIGVDIRFISKKQYGAALLYFTGSGEFNKAMRSYAKKKGYKLNEYGLYKGNKLVASEREEDIFKKLGIPYMEPKDRELEELVKWLK